MIVLLRMCVAAESCSKVCLTTIIDAFFQYVVCNQRRDRGIRRKWGFNFLLEVKSGGMGGYLTAASLGI